MITNLVEKPMELTENQFITSNSHSSPPYITGYETIYEYLAWKETYSKAAYKAYRIWVERFQNHVGKAPEHLKLEDVVGFFRKIKQSYAPKNVQYGMSIVRNYLKFCQDQNRLSIPLYLIKVPSVSANSHNALTVEEYQQILNAFGRKKLNHLSLRNLCMIRLLYDTGMRVGELSSLNIDDIKPSMSAVIKTEKTSNKRRVFWTSETDKMVRQYWGQRVSSEMKVGKITGALFLATKGRTTDRIATRSIQRMIKNITRSVGITRKISPHSFRHGFIHKLAGERVPDSVIALFVGHSTPHTVAQYTKLSRVELEETYRNVFSTATVER